MVSLQIKQQTLEVTINMRNNQVQPGEKIIGLSISLCILAIIEGKINACDVVKIIGSTRARNKPEWRDVLKIYKQSYWHKNPIGAAKILRRFIAEGRVEQPRLQNNKRMPTIHDGIWVTSEDDIRWTDEPELEQ